jgi:Fe2+ or Zn2+ uptake regulation protein
MMALKEKILSAIKRKSDWMMIKEIMEELKKDSSGLDVHRMYLSGYLDAMVDFGIFEFKPASSAKRFS